MTDPPDPRGYDDYFNMYSAPPLERLRGWTKVEAVSTSPNLLPGRDYELIVVAFREPRANNTSGASVQVRHGRRRLKIRYEGGEDLALL